jgi:hypothetical protein
MPIADLTRNRSLSFVARTPIGNRHSAIANDLNSATLRGTTSVVRNWRRIAYRDYPDACVRYCANRGLTTAAWPFHTNFALLHARLVRFFRSFVSSLLRGKRSSFARAAKSARAGRRLRNQVSFQIGNRNHRIVERGCDVRDSCRHILLLFLTKNFFLSSGSFCHKRVSGQLSVVSCQALVAFTDLQLTTNN